MDRSERIGLGISATGHGLLIAVLALGLLHWGTSVPLAPPTMEVSLTDTIALDSRATSQEAPQSAEAPELGAVEPDAAAPEPRVAPEPALKPVVKSEPIKPQPNKAEPAKAVTRPARASRLGDDFLKGLDTPAKSDATAQTASGNAPLSAEAARALSAEIRRQIKPFWRAPTGVDADKLITTLRWRLNADGSIASGPTLVEQTGRTASNQPQQQLHVEAAMRAIRAAAPFRLPDEYYDNWKLIEFGFDKRL